MRNNRLIKTISLGLATTFICMAAGSADFASTVYADGGDYVNETTDEGQIYCIGSVSKVYVTTAVMQLVEQGKVDLDSPVTDYIDDFEMADERYKDITVRMLMNHTSGIPGTTATNIFLFGDNDFSFTDNMLKNLKNQKLKAAPGEYASYCNDGFELLEIIVERVSGMSYTEYIEKNIADKIGAENLYTGENVFGNEKLADIYPDGRNRYDTEYVMGFGTGGAYSTSVDSCEFGSTFFSGDNRLLSEKSKNEMSTLWSSGMSSKYDPECMDQSGLGWDLVSIPLYEEAGVKAVFKGGDSSNYHAALLVLPEEEISVSVNTSGGSSEFDLAMAEALANIALEEKGIEVEEVTSPEVSLQDEVPDSFKQYEGLYTMSGEPAMISFPDMKYMLVETLGYGTSKSYYMYSDKGFVEVTGDVEAGDARIAKDFGCLNFVDVDDSIYVTQEVINRKSGLISSYQKSYIGEKLDINHVADTVLNAWKERGGEKYVVTSEKYSSSAYETPFSDFLLLEDAGYVFPSLGIGSGALKIVDENHLERVATIPSSANRDNMNIEFDKDGVMHISNGIDMIAMSGFENFTNDLKEVDLTTEKAKWFYIDDSMANKNISLDRPENSAVYVYDKYGKVTYSTHMVDYGNVIHLQKDGYIVFVGETGDSVKINQ